MTTPAPNGDASDGRRLRIPVLLWIRLARELGRRGDARRESGAFLLGAADASTGTGTAKVTRFVCYDDLDPHALDTGIVRMSGDGLSKLWSLCDEDGLAVLADVHAHPGNWVGQSESDRSNPMVSLPGHVAFILPNYAAGWRIGFGGVGIYEYLGKLVWRDVQAGGRRPRVRRCLW
jgi:hypothetical protein